MKTFFIWENKPKNSKLGSWLIWWGKKDLSNLEANPSYISQKHLKVQSEASSIPKERKSHQRQK